MSKFYKMYKELKKQNSKTIYLFKSGIFFIALDDDAYTLSNVLNLKLGHLNESIVKCGFPCSSIEKYTRLFNIHCINVKLIESNDTIYNLNEYKQNSATVTLFESIVAVDTNNLSVAEAYKFIEDLKSKVDEINGVIK